MSGESIEEWEVDYEVSSDDSDSLDLTLWQRMLSKAGLFVPAIAYSFSYYYLAPWALNRLSAWLTSTVRFHWNVYGLIKEGV